MILDTHDRKLMVPTLVGLAAWGPRATCQEDRPPVWQVSATGAEHTSTSRPPTCAARTRSHGAHIAPLPTPPAGPTHLSCPAPLRSLMPRGLHPSSSSLRHIPSTTSQHAAHALRRALPLRGPASTAWPG